MLLLLLSFLGQAPVETKTPPPPNPIVVQPQKIIPDPTPTPVVSDEPHVTLPKEIRARAGSWIVVAPLSINGGPPQFDIPAGMTEVDISAIFGPDAIKNAKGKVLQSDVDGTYVISAWNAKGDVASKISKCSVIITGGLPPVPVTPPGPPIPPPPPPLPNPPTPVDLGPDVFGFAKLSMTQVGLLSPEAKAEAANVANNFEAISAQLAANAAMTVAQANAALKAKNGTTIAEQHKPEWLAKFFNIWQTATNAGNANGTITTRDHYVTIFSDTVKGIRAAIK